VRIKTNMRRCKRGLSGGLTLLKSPSIIDCRYRRPIIGDQGRPVNGRAPGRRPFHWEHNTKQEEAGGVLKIVILNRPILRRLKGCGRSPAFSVVRGLECNNPRSRPGKFHQGLSLKEFAEQFPDLLFRGLQCPLTSWSRSIHAANFPGQVVLLGTEQPIFFESVKHRVQRSRAEFVTMPCQLFDHTQAEDSLFCCVVKNMKADKARIQLPCVHKFLFGCSHYRIPLSKISCTEYR